MKFSSVLKSHILLLDLNSEILSHYPKILNHYPEILSFYNHSTVTLFARLRGLSIEHFLARAV